MYLSILAFVAGSVFAANAPMIFIHGHYVLFLGLLALAGMWYRLLRVVSCALLGILFSQYLGFQYLQGILPKALEGKEIVVEGRVSSLPKEAPGHIRFEFEQLRSKGNFVSKRVVLNWYYQNAIPSLRPGDTWQFVVKLNQPHGVVNRGLFNVETWLLTRNIYAQGYIRKSVKNKRVQQSRFHQLHHQIRYRLRALIESRLMPDRERGLIIALMIGDSAQIDTDTWKILSQTGTNHLLIISGLHIGFVAGIFLYLFSLKPVGLKRSASVSMTMSMTLCYGLLAGMGLPVQRALLMVIIGLSAIHFKRRVPLLLVFLYALLIVTLVNPFSALSAGYWLSFGAVASLVFAFGGRPNYLNNAEGKIKSALTTQLVIFVLMSPILIYWINQFSLIGIFVNILAIPFVAFIIVPLLLLATPLLLLELTLANVILDSAHYLLQHFMTFVEFFANLRLVYSHSSSNLIDIIVACLGGVVFLLPRGLVPRYLALVLFVPLFLPRVTEMESGDLVIKILDVGQGLSVIVETRRHLVVYDTGPSYGNGMEAGSRIVSPAIQRLGRKQIHTLIVSHGDSDHAGGLDGLLRQHKIQQVFAGEPELILHAGNVRSCHQGVSWTLDEVGFSFVNPRFVTEVGRNNKSCVLMIKAGDYHVLLPGDIESIMEQSLTDSSLVGVNLLVSPHHGSLTSSSPGFLNRLMPEVVVVSAGYNNKFGHPNKRIVRRYQHRGMRMINTAESGEVVVKFLGGKVVYESTRNAYPRFWYERLAL
ncbi:MAG: competence protein ComEC [Candidatus Azotimanducaceae bacterium]|jgi:competence protein ComEC